MTTKTEPNLYGTGRKGNQVPTIHIHNPNARSLYDMGVIRSAIRDWISEPFPWQEIIYRDALAVDLKGKLAHQVVCLSVARRNGKTEMQVALMAVFAVMFSADVLYNAPDGDLAKKVYDRFVEAAADPKNRLSRYFPGLEAKNKVLEQVIQAYDPESGAKLGTVSFRTRGGKGGRGGQYDVVIFDEAQDLTTEQYQRYGPTNAARKKHDRGKKKQPISLTILFGTPPPLDTKTEGLVNGMLFRNVRTEMLTQTDVHWESRKWKGRSWIEWGADHVIDKNDRDAWYKYNPSMGYLDGFEEYFENLILDAEAFSVEHLGYWTRQNRERAIEIGVWNKLSVTPAELNSQLKGRPFSLALKNSILDPKVLHLGSAFRLKDNRIGYKHFVTFYMDEPGWDTGPNGLQNVLTDLVKRGNCVGLWVDGVSATEEAKRILNNAGLWNPNRSRVRQGKTTMVTMADMTGAAAGLLTSITSKRLVHRNPKILHSAVLAAKKRKIGEQGFGFTSASTVDVVPLEVCALAVYGIEAKGQMRGEDDMSMEGRNIKPGLGAL